MKWFISSKCRSSARELSDEELEEEFFETDASGVGYRLSCLMVDIEGGEGSVADFKYTMKARRHAVKHFASLRRSREQGSGLNNAIVCGVSSA